MAGNTTLMVSGSDSHGTPVTVRAEQENTTPQKIFQKFRGAQKGLLTLNQRFLPLFFYALA